jgi:large subunit ribosomal protein L9
MKVILNKDLSPLGEEGDVKDVARGYARNYLFPRMIAVPYNEGTIRQFEARKGDIEARKVEKREAAKGLKERLEALELSLSMPAGANGRLFGSVTSQTLAEELNRQGFQIERKRIELPGATFKSVGKYKVTVHLYESAAAEISVSVQALVEKTEEAPARSRRRRPGDRAEPRTEGTAAPVPETTQSGTPAGEAPAGEAPAVPAGEAPAVPAGEVPSAPESPPETAAPAAGPAPAEAAPADTAPDTPQA